MKNQKNVFDLFTSGSAKFVRITTRTDVTKKINAGSRKMIGGPVTCVKVFTASVGWNYSKVVNARQEREHKEPSFSPAPTYCTLYGAANSGLAYKTKNPDTWYLRYYNPQTLSEVYYIGDRQATPAEVQTIKDGFYKRNGEGKQNLRPENQVIVRNVKFSNLIEVFFDQQKVDLKIPEKVREEVSPTC